MHVVLVTTSYPNSPSGNEAAGGFVAEFASQLALHTRVTVVAATPETADERREGNVVVRRFSVPRWPLSLLRPWHPVDWRPIVSTIMAGQRALDEVVARDRPDYVLALWALPSGHWARTVWQRDGIPYGIWALGSDIWSLGRIPLLRAYLRRVLSDAERRFADGMNLADAVSELSGGSCHFMPSARRMPDVPVGAVSATPPYRLAYLGRWHPNKGVDIFLDALGTLDDEDWRRIDAVRINGGGPLDEVVRRKVAALRAAGRPVTMGGFLDIDGATALLDWTDYLALPSRIESIPVIFSDAAQRGRPLVATPVGDMPALFARRSFGVMSQGTTVSSYADAVRVALQISPSSFEQKLLEFAREFDIRVVAERFAAAVAGVRQ